MNEKLSTTPPESAIYELKYALQYLAESLTAHDQQIIYKVEDANRCLNKFFGLVQSIPEFSEKEANLSSSLHCFLRKYDDSPVSTILYRLIDENRGMSVWHDFIKSALENNLDIKKIKRFSLDCKTYTTDDIFMERSIEIWKEGNLQHALEWYKNLKD